MEEMIPSETILSKIYLIRGIKVMLDRDLAELYGVETGQLKRQVRRNIDRFPEDFMLELTKDELENLRCQFGISSWGGPRYPPMVFTENGVAMLSTVLNSKRAVQVNIQIMRTFTKLRNVLSSTDDIEKKINNLEEFVKIKFKETDNSIQTIISVLNMIMNPEYESENMEQIGFKD
ncbi:ORF6N domain-containing protein [Spirochaetota bacterium]